ncbi:hypothetical protein HM1_3036 [Heliomicrobium modesticaldum Ice1]|uniref:Uncharacterized protein n=1 Tax=Heliobacterium modesticaldum (strain ATCC 51547 / Ice1) TaxID=498761 RepID=B0TDL8_HELMI|nr:hypothetical protein HM1_3036 [Heliomicrobium modesticaldum Ice1]
MVKEKPSFGRLSLFGQVIAEAEDIRYSFSSKQRKYPARKEKHCRLSK